MLWLSILRGRGQHGTLFRGESVKHTLTWMPLKSCCRFPKLPERVPIGPNMVLFGGVGRLKLGRPN